MLRRLKISAVVLIAVVIVVAIPGVIYSFIPSDSSSDGVPLPIYLGVVAAELLIALVIGFTAEHELGRRQKIRQKQELFAFRFPLLLSAGRAEDLVTLVSLELLDGTFYWDDNSMTLRCEYDPDVLTTPEEGAALEATVADVIRMHRPKSAWLMLAHSFV